MHKSTVKSTAMTTASQSRALHIPAFSMLAAMTSEPTRRQRPRIWPQTPAATEPRRATADETAPQSAAPAQTAQNAGLAHSAISAATVTVAENPASTA